MTTTQNDLSRFATPGEARVARKLVRAALREGWQVSVRDADAAHWVGFFRPWVKDGRSHVAATVPGWCK